MSYKPLRQQSFKETQIALYADGDRFKGVIRWPPRSEVRNGDNLEVLWAELVRDRGVVHPNYFGWSGARNRFLKLFPRGFEDPLYDDYERTYKNQASTNFGRECPLDAALNGSGDAEAAVKAIKATNLLYPYGEKPGLLKLCQGTNGREFLQTMAWLATGRFEDGFGAAMPLLKAAGARNWPAATYFPFLWRPDTQMLLRPGVTCDFSSRVGGRFDYNYKSVPNVETYKRLLSLAQETKAAIASIAPLTRPLDGIDVQSFIWVVSNQYGPDEEAELQKKREALAGGAA